MSGIESWSDQVCKSLENVDKIYGRVMGTARPQSDDEPLSVIFKV
jgi:hypothetical protein